MIRKSKLLILLTLIIFSCDIPGKIEIKNNPAPAAIPMTREANIKERSFGSLMTVRNLIIAKAPTRAKALATFEQLVLSS